MLRRTARMPGRIRDFFQFDENYLPVAVAGCPPDAFSATGQLWGNPLYDWKKHKEEGYFWWTKRMLRCMELYDIVRIDHFRGFDEYYSIPYGDKTAEKGHWEKGPGLELFHVLNSRIDFPAGHSGGSWFSYGKCSGNGEGKRLSGNEGTAVCL